MKDEAEILHDVVAAVVEPQKIYERIHDIYADALFTHGESPYTPDMAWRRVYAALGLKALDARNAGVATDDFVESACDVPAGIFVLDETWPKFAEDVLGTLSKSCHIAIKRLVAHVIKSTRLTRLHEHDDDDLLAEGD